MSIFVRSRITSSCPNPREMLEKARAAEAGKLLGQVTSHLKSNPAAGKLLRDMTGSAGWSRMNGAARIDLLKAFLAKKCDTRFMKSMSAIVQTKGFPLLSEASQKYVVQNMATKGTSSSELARYTKAYTQIFNDLPFQHAKGATRDKVVKYPLHYQKLTMSALTNRKEALPTKSELNKVNNAYIASKKTSNDRKYAKWVVERRNRIWKSYMNHWYEMHPAKGCHTYGEFYAGAYGDDWIKILHSLAEKEKAFASKIMELPLHQRMKYYVDNSKCPLPKK